MIERRLHRQIEKAARRVRHVRIIVAWAGVWLAAAAMCGLLLLLNRWTPFYVRPALSALGVVTASAALIFGWMAWRSARNPQTLARRIEAVYPELRNGLLTAVEQRPSLPGGRYGFLQDRVIQQSLEHAYGNRWERAISGWKLCAAHSFHAVGVAALILSMWGLLTHARTPLPRFRILPSNSAPAAYQTEMKVEPGNTEVERGTSLLVVARFQGPLPAEVTLHYQSKDATQQLAMSKSLDDPLFGIRIAEVKQPLTYRVSFADRHSEWYKVSVFDYPALQRADAHLHFPQYASQDDKVLEDVRQISVAEGTKVTLLCRLNKPVTHAQLVERDGTKTDLAPESGGSSVYTTSFVLDRSRRAELALTDEAGRSNKERYEFAFNVLPNKPPDIKLAKPARDVQVSPLEELLLSANAWDDYGLQRIGVSYLSADGQTQERVLSQAVAGKQRIEVKDLLAFEELRAKPDDLLSYHFWAEDLATDGSVRRASSDMFFAEVRPFDEIFRQGQQPSQNEASQSQQSQGAAAQGEKLAELQKQIINATWKLIRRETGAAPTDAYPADIGLLVDSQTQALGQTEELQQDVQNAEAALHVKQAQQAMTQAVEELSKARDKLDPKVLPAALRSEQQAYRELLRMRAREHQVVRGNSRSRSRGQQSSRSQQQLQQLELKNDQNRYETERLAKSQNDEQNQAMRQVLNRLRELAQRQSDVNQRLKELESALREAKDQQQREELERQLKRLREQQQELLRDTDELMSRMQEPQNQERLSDNRQELEQARDQVRQASEALEQGMVSRAITSGTRAQQQLENMRDDMRKATSGQFTEEMRGLRETATRLDEQQNNVAQQMEELSRPSEQNRSLRDRGERERITEQFQSQRALLEELLQRMRQTVLDSEQAEPLLAEKLYDTYRQAEHQQPGRALESAERSLQQGLVDDATREERGAGASIHQLREGVDRAAESVLGDETESLRRAHEAVQELIRQLQDEMSRATGQAKESAESPTGQSSPSKPQSSSRSTSEPSEQAKQPRTARGGGTKNSQDGEQQAKGQSSRQQRSQENSPNQGQKGNRNQTASTDQQNQGSPGDNQANQAQSGARQSGQGQQQGQPGQSARPNGNTPNDRQSGSPTNQRGGSTGGLGGFERLTRELTPGSERLYAPLTGGDFVQWSDRLRDVEEMVTNPQLRSEAARIRDRARGFRQDLQRHSAPPNWDLIQLEVTKPLVELRDRLMEEVRRRSSQESLVPIDRDPVPPRYQEQVRRYYEELGSGQ